MADPEWVPGDMLGLSLPAHSEDFADPMRDRSRYQMDSEVRPWAMGHGKSDNTRSHGLVFSA
jgi:hypothetical protein